MIAAAKAEKERAKAEALAAKEAAKNKAAQPVETTATVAADATAPATDAQTADNGDGSRLSQIKKKLFGMFGG